MRVGDLDAAVRGERAHREVQGRRREDAHVHRGAARLDHALADAAGQRGPRGAVVAADEPMDGSQADTTRRWQRPNWNSRCAIAHLRSGASRHPGMTKETPMRLRIAHTTSYRYEPAATSVIQTCG